MFSWVDGAVLSGRLTSEGMVAAGVLLAELHEQASATNDPIPKELHADHVVYFHRENRVLTYESEHGSLFVEAIERVQTMIDSLWADSPHRPHLLHGDFGPHNLLTCRGQLRPIDFQDLQFGFDVQDVGLSCADLGRNHPEMIEPFKSGYASVRPWPGLSPELQAGLAAARSLNVMNLGLHLRRSGIAEHLDDHAKRVATWMSTDS